MCVCILNTVSIQCILYIHICIQYTIKFGDLQIIFDIYYSKVTIVLK